MVFWLNIVWVHIDDDVIKNRLDPKDWVMKYLSMASDS